MSLPPPSSAPSGARTTTATALLSSICDINSRADVPNEQRLTTAQLMAMLQCTSCQLKVGDAVAVQDGLRRPKFKVASVNADGTFDLASVDSSAGEQARLAVPREQVRHPDDVRVSEWMLSAAKRHTLERGAGQSAVSEQRYLTRVDKRAIESMIEFAASPAAVRYLSGRSGFVQEVVQRAWQTVRQAHVLGRECF